jgi:hypothetical protein
MSNGAEFPKCLTKTTATGRVDARISRSAYPERIRESTCIHLDRILHAPAVIGAIQTALRNFGFTGVNILEPSCGTGRFFGFLPSEISRYSNLYGVELDELTVRIARQLYQKAEIQITGFEKILLLMINCAIPSPAFCWFSSITKGCFCMS